MIVVRPPLLARMNRRVAASIASTLVEWLAQKRTAYVRVHRNLALNRGIVIIISDVGGDRRLVRFGHVLY